MQYSAMTAADGDVKPAAIKDGLLQDSIQKEECERSACGNPIPPDQVAVYCSNECAFADR